MIYTLEQDGQLENNNSRFMWSYQYAWIWPLDTTFAVIVITKNLICFYEFSFLHIARLIVDRHQYFCSYFLSHLSLKILTFFFIMIACFYLRHFDEHSWNRANVFISGANSCSFISCNKIDSHFSYAMH